jgi:hypothetical protein
MTKANTQEERGHIANLDPLTSRVQDSRTSSTSNLAPIVSRLRSKELGFSGVVVITTRITEKEKAYDKDQVKEVI